MTRWRLVLSIVLLLVVGLPLALPLLEALRDLSAWPSWSERERFLALGGNTLALVAGTLALTVPVGIVGAIVLYRTDLPGRRVLRLLIVLALKRRPPPLAWAGRAGGGVLPHLTATIRDGTTPIAFA